MSRRSAVIALSFWAILLAASAVFAPRVRVENPPDQWSVNPPTPEQRLWRFTKDQFGRRDLLLVGLRCADGSPPFAAAETLEVWLARQREVSSLFGPGEARRIQRLLPSIASAEVVRSLRRAVMSDDRTLALLYVSLEQTEGPRAFQSKASLVSRIEREAAITLPEGTRVLLAGQPALNVSLQELIRKDALTAVPLALAAMLLLLASIAGLASLGPVVAVSASLLVLLGGLGALDVPLSAATIVALPITAVVGLSYSAYVLAALSRSADGGAALREAFAPLAWAYVTTVASILTFVFSPIPALRLYAIATAAGITVGVLAAGTLLPVLHRGRGPVRLGGIARVLGRAAFTAYAWAARHVGRAVAAWSVLILLSLAGLAQLRLEPNNFLSFFPRAHRVLAAHEDLDRSFGGSVPVEVLAQTPTPDAATNPHVRERLLRFVAEAGKLHRIGPALTPPGPAAIRLGAESGVVLANWFRARDPHYTRAMFPVPVLPTAQATVLFRSLDSLALALSDSEARVRVTGVLPSSISLLQTLVDVQVSNLGSLLVLMFLALAIAARGIRAGALLLIPNVVPLLAVGGAMGVLGVALDFTTITILSMLLGIAVDNTIHLRWAVRQDLRQELRGVVPRAVRRVSTAATLTAATTVAGFGILIFSPFPASQRVGLFMAIGLGVAWLADMTLTPMLVHLERGARRRQVRPSGGRP